MKKNYLNNEQFEEAAQLILILENPRHFRTAMGMEHNFEIIYAYSVGLAHYGDPRISKSILYKYRYDENRNKKLNYTGTEKENISTMTVLYCFFIMKKQYKNYFSLGDMYSITP